MFRRNAAQNSRPNAPRRAAAEREPDGTSQDAKRQMLKLFWEMSMLAFEAQQAIWLRGMKIAMGGPLAKREADLMVKEKIVAAQTAAVKAASGKGPVGIVRGYRRKVRANVRRLSR